MAPFKTLGETLKAFNIDTRALSQIKNRVFVVGRFNQRSQGQPPEVYLFTNRKDLSPQYRRNFQGNAANHLKYEDFVRTLAPAVAERVVKQGRFHGVEQIIPDGSTAGEGASVINTFNYFFQRAVANTEQGAFQGKQAPTGGDLLQPGREERGKGILTQIRKNLETFCGFQPQTGEIVDTMSELLSQCAKHHGIPAFAPGDPFPPGFSEELINFLYDESDESTFSLDSVDLRAEHWRGLWDADKKVPTDAGEKTIAVVCAFRDAMIGIPREQYNIRFGGKNLNSLAQDCVKKKQKLAKGFRRSRDAFNGLRQILRSRVLLSMVLEWLLGEYRQIDAVVAATAEAAKDRALEDAILNRPEENGLAKPVRRPSRKERARFSDLLTENYEKLLDAIVSEGREFDSKVDKLPKEIQDVAHKVVAERKQREALVKIAGAKQPLELQKAFRDATKTILLDVLCPVLYRVPVLTTQMLKKYFRQEILAAYLTAVFLSDKDQDRVRKIAEDHLEFFESKIDKVSKEIKGEGEILARLLSDFVAMLASPEMEERLSKDIQVLYDVLALFEADEAMQGLGVGGIVAKRVSEPEKSDLEKSSEMTQIGQAPIAKALKEKVKAVASKRYASVLKAAGFAATAAPAGAAGAAEPGAAGAAVADDPELAAFAPEQSEVEARIASIVKRIIPDRFEEKPTETEREAWIETAEKELSKDKAFMESLQRSITAFERTLHLIYSRYNSNPDKRTFRNKVERMALINMMLLFQRDLGFGKVLSNLYQLLLDLVLYLDPDDPNPREFMRKKSLTLYFDDADIAKDDQGHSGVTDLRQTLIAQAENSLQNIVTFVSDLRGVKHLMDSVSANREAEVVVINATAKEFLEWVTDENLAAGVAVQRLRAGGLVTTKRAGATASDTVIPPGFAYISDIAFTDDYSKEDFLSNLAALRNRDERLVFLVPPLCISTPAQSVDDWDRYGEKLAGLIGSSPAPVLILGPSPNLNPPGDGFPTILPAGYLFAAHLLSQPSQDVHIHGVKRQSKGRFRIVGSGFVDMAESLRRILWGSEVDGGDVYAFAGDFFLYLITTILATAEFQEGAIPVNRAEFLRFFSFEEGDFQSTDRYKTIEVLSGALPGDDPYRFKLTGTTGGGEFDGVSVAPIWGPNHFKGGVKPFVMKDVGWCVNLMKRIFGKPGEPSEPEQPGRK